MSVLIEAKSFSGKYGASEDVGDIIHVHMEIDSNISQNNNSNKEIIFLIDVSASMTESMKSVKSSILAFRDAITNKTPREMERMDYFERDNLLRNTINIRIIAFSNQAKEIWSNECHELFEDAILNLETEAMTNMGDAIKLAFEKTHPARYTWIIAMTDGNSNRGPCKTAGSFQQLVATNKPINAKIVSLGYGENFDPEVLNKVGSFVYVENSEMIPVVLGNLAEEIMTSVGFNCVIDIPDKLFPSELNDDTIIVPDGEDAAVVGQVIVGDRVVGPICAGKGYDYVYLPHGNNISSNIKKYHCVNIYYMDITTDLEVNTYQPIVHTGDEPPEKIRSLFFKAECERLIYRLYRVIQKGNRDTVTREVKRVRGIIDKWDDQGNDQVSASYKDDVLKMLETIDNTQHNRGSKLASTTLNYAVGTGYTMPGDVDGYAAMTATATDHYLMSPLINGDNQ